MTGAAFISEGTADRPAHIKASPVSRICRSSFSFLFRSACFYLAVFICLFRFLRHLLFHLSLSWSSHWTVFFPGMKNVRDSFYDDFPSY